VSIQQLLQSGSDSLREFGLTFARLIAGMAVDPHGYFEKKYVARIERATSEQEIRGVLAQLVQWAASSSITEVERNRLNQQLGAEGLPSIDDLRAHLLP